jgi:transposase
MLRSREFDCCYKVFADRGLRGAHQLNSTIMEQNQPSNQTQKSIAAWVGIDWADKKHWIVVRPADGSKPFGKAVDHKPESLDEFFLEQQKHYPDQSLGVCLEQSRGPLIYALLKYSFVRIFPVNPRMLSDFRNAFSMCKAKDDPSDADLLSDIGQKHSDRLRELQPDDLSTRTLRFLVEDRRNFVDHRTALHNELTATLKCYYPLALDLLGKELERPMALEFLRRWPTLDKLKKAPEQILRAFFYRHNSRSEERITERIETIKKAKPLTTDEAVLKGMTFKLSRLLKLMGEVQSTVTDYDQEIAKQMENHPDAFLFKSLPGAGPVFAARLAAAFGTVRANYPSAEDMQCFSGVAPVKRESGNQLQVSFRRQRPIFLHQTMVEFAKNSVLPCDWAHLLYDELKKKGKRPFQAYRVIAFKWIRIIRRCWENKVPYDENVYLQSLKREGVELYRSLYENLEPATKIGE